MTDLKSAFYVFLGDNGGVLSFSSTEAIKRFAEEEKEAFAFLKAPKDFPLKDVIERQKSAPESMVEAIKSAKSEDHLRLLLQSVFQAYEAGKVIASTSMPGRMMTAMEDEIPMTLGLLFGAVSEDFPKAEELFNKKEEVSAFVSGYAIGFPYSKGQRLKRVHTDIPDMTKRLDQMTERMELMEETVTRADETLSALRINLDYAKKKLNETVDASDELLAEIGRTAEEKVNEVLKAGGEKIEKQAETLKEVSKSRMKIKNAVDCWMDVAEMHMVKQMQMTWAFVGTSVLGILVVLGIALALVKSGTGDNAMLVIGVLGLPIFIFVTLLINLARSRQLSEQKAAEAHERFVMVETLVALETEGKAAENERRQVMKDLFIKRDKAQ